MKKNLFKKAGNFLLLGGMLFGAMLMNSQNLYVYYAASSPASESFLLDDVQELTFSGSNLVVNKKSGAPVTFTDLKFFALKNFDSPSGVAPRLYVDYTASSPADRSFLVNDVQELTFSGSNLVVNTKTGDPVTLTALKFFALRNFDSPSGIAPNTAEAAISVYPNPTVADVIVHSTTTITGLGLYNLQGQKLLQLYPESLEATIPLASYPSGLYLLQVADESGITIKKIIKN